MPAVATTPLDVAAQVDPDIRRNVFFDDDDALHFGRLNGETNQEFGRIQFVSAGPDFRIESVAEGTGTDRPMTFYTGGSERMRIHETGPVLINFTTLPGPGGRLQVGGSAGLAEQILVHATVDGATVNSRLEAAVGLGATLRFGDFGVTSTSFVPSGSLAGLQADEVFVLATADALCSLGLGTGGNFPIRLFTNDVERQGISATGNFTFSQAVQTSGNPTFATWTPAAHTTLTAAETIDFNFNMGRTIQFTTGGVIALQRAFLLQAPTYNATAATQTITQAATFAINAAPTGVGNVTIDRPLAFFIQAGESRFSGSIGIAVREIAIDRTLDDTDGIVDVDASGALRTITLPALANVLGRVYHIAKNDSSANVVRLDGNGAETINGSATHDLTVQYESVTIVALASDWRII